MKCVSMTVYVVLWEVNECLCCDAVCYAESCTLKRCVLVLCVNGLCASVFCFIFLTLRRLITIIFKGDIDDLLLLSLGSPIEQ